MKKMKSQAFLIIKTKEGNLDTAIQGISDAEEVKDIYHATGAFDLIALINTETISQIIDYVSSLRKKDYIKGIATIYVSPVKDTD
ncbi:Lrp/AsnC ligand binding domain-containing protein [Candidatus Woesearchaeota archaeon]|nr:Lrp/AsnC ligand binding domain-containing protein [Candidatus Woesearchaeota archaeon]